MRFQAIRNAARRAASQLSSSAATDSTSATAATAASAAALVLVAAVGDGLSSRDDHARVHANCQESRNGSSSASSSVVDHDPSSGGGGGIFRQQQDTQQQQQQQQQQQLQKHPSPFRNFVATSSATSTSSSSSPSDSPTATTTTAALCEHSSASTYHSGLIPDHDLRLQRALTSRRMALEQSVRTFFSVYEVDFDNPLGSGSYGDVYLCREILTGDQCALKKIPKEFTEDDEFQREMNALLHIRAQGGHPNICMLRENFDEQDDYLLVLDLVDGGEMFEHLINHGAYSEADASRLLRQVASALDFVHGIGVVHADMKPENIMLRKSRGDAVIKLIDFGCSEVLSHPEEASTGVRLPSRNLTHEEGATTAYCPPEAFGDESVPLDPSVDMWALGVIVYMMLIGRHPFDLNCDASDEEIGRRIKEYRGTPLRDCAFAGDLSPSALDLIGKLMEPDPKRRMTAHEMLHHPWVTGETASEYVLEGSAERLEQLQRYRSGIEKTVIERLLSFHAGEDQGSLENTIDKQTSLLERAFDHLDKDKKGFLSKGDLKSLPSTRLVRRKTHGSENVEMSFNNFSDIIGQSMRSVHFKKGQVVYNEHDEGDYMYFINSGTIEVSTKDGFRTQKGQGDHFGKGGILGRKRRTTITCTTPVNALRIDKDFFSKYIIKGSPLATKLRENANKEKFDRALFIMGRDGDMTEATYKRGDFIFKEGEVPQDAYIVKEGLIDILAADHQIYPVKPGRLFGIQSQILKRNRKASARCVADECVIRRMPIERLEKLAEEYPVLKSTLNELALRQEFRRAVVLRRMKSFPNKEELKEAFDEIDTDRSGTLDAEELRTVMQSLGAAFSDNEIETLIQTLDLNESGSIDFHEFEHVFGEN